MTPEKLMDAMNLLPDDLLEETNALRQRRRIPWKSLTALAACLSLVAALWCIRPVSKDSAAGTAGENGVEMECLEDGSEIVADRNTSAHSSIPAALDYEFTVDKVYDDYITAYYGEKDCTAVIYLYNLEKTPHLEPGRHIRVYWEADSAEVGSYLEITPYKIELMCDCAPTVVTEEEKTEEQNKE